MTNDLTQLRSMSIDRLALMLKNQNHPDAQHLLQQVEGWQRLRTKVPTWAAVDELLYPPRLSLEQCSGEVAARYKAEVVRHLFPSGGVTMADLTGGLGVDFSFVAPIFQRAVYVERQEELCRIARHNFPLLGLPAAEVVHADGVDFLKKMQPADLLFLDPARRDSAGRKTVLITDCEPDITSMKPLLLSKARYVVVKLSPMLDIAASVRALGCVEQVHVFSTGGECKDLLLVLSREAAERSTAANPTVFVREGDVSLRFTAEEEANATVHYADEMGQFLFEPGAAVLKAGAFKWVAQHYAVEKLAPSSHLYASTQEVPGFPGRSFRVLGVYGFNKADIKQLRTITDKANLTVRNFPASVDALRKKLRLKEGGNIYIFATTMASDAHVLVVCEKFF